MTKQKITTKWRLEKYRQMPAELKLEIGLELSELAREFRKQGAKQTQTSYDVRPEKPAVT